MGVWVLQASVVYRAWYLGVDSIPHLLSDVSTEGAVLYNFQLLHQT